MAKRSVALSPTEFAQVGRVLARQAEVLTCRHRAKGQAPIEAMGWALSFVIHGFELEDQRRKDEIRRLLKRHLEGRFIARNGGWRELRSTSPLAREIQIQKKKSAIWERARRAERRVTA